MPIFSSGPSKGVGPSVTEVLGLVQDFSKIPPTVLRKASDRGSEVHHVCYLLDRDELSEDFMSDEIAQYVRAYKGFLSVYKPEYVQLEHEVQLEMDGLYYHGRFDRSAIMDENPWILDIKTSAQVNAKACLVQLSGYSIALAPPKEPLKMGVIHLKKDGKFAFRDLTHYRELGIDLFKGLLHAWYGMRHFEEATLK